MRPDAPLHDDADRPPAPRQDWKNGVSGIESGGRVVTLDSGRGGGGSPWTTAATSGEPMPDFNDQVVAEFRANHGKVGGP
ncbi:MAG: hypothetical protein ABW364_16270, partial [Rhodococcus fascians]